MSDIDFLEVMNSFLLLLASYLNFFFKYFLFSHIVCSIEAATSN